MSRAPFDLPGPQFLTLYIGLLCLTICTALLVPHMLRPAGTRTYCTAADELAWLAGGQQRFTDTVVTRLLSSGALDIVSGTFKPRAHTSSSAAERSVLALAAPVRWSAIDQTLKPHAEATEHRLVSAGLALDAVAAMQLRIWQTLPYVVLFGLGTIKWVIGSLRYKPTGHLTLLLIITAVLALCRCRILDRRTRAGIEALDLAKQQSSRIKRAPTGPEMDLAVALFGTTVLQASPLDGYHQLRNAGGSSSSGSGCSSGGGCGGGGCGGCS
jgi:uncharacterized protein (TIGR04222 family)